MAVITKEMLEEYFDTEDGKVVLEAISTAFAKELGWKSPEEIQGLVDKRDELLRKNAELKKRPTIEESDKKLLDFIKEKDILDIEDLEKVFSGQAKGGEITEEEKRAFKKAQKELETLKAENSKISSLFNSERELRIKSLRDVELNNYLIEVKVKPEVIPVVKRFLVDELKHEISENGEIKFIAKDDITSAKDYVLAWAKTDMAKPFIMPLENTGAGNHLKGTPGKKSYTREEIRNMPPVEKQKVMTDPSVEVVD